MDAKMLGTYPYFRKTYEVLRRRNHDELMPSAAMCHAKVLMKASTNTEFETREEECNALMSKLFFENVENYPTEKHASKMGENYAWPVSIVPSEIFGDLESTEFLREKTFFKNLKVGDAVVIKVTSTTPVSYISKVVHKYGSKRILEDLNIEVSMKRAEANNFLQEELSKGDCLAVVVSEIQEEGTKPKIFVSLNDSNIFPGKKLEKKLGRISDEEVASYISLPETRHFSSYSDYLTALPSFHNHLLLDKLYSDFGVDTNKIDSFIQKFANLRCEDEYTGEAILKKSKSRDITKYLSEALVKRQEGNFAKALEYTNLAIELNPEVVKSYEIRALIYREMNIRKRSQKTFSDWCQIHKIDENNTVAKEELSVWLSKAAKRFYKSNKYAKAAELAQKALKFSSSNEYATKLVEHLKGKHPEAFLDSDENTLQALKEGLVAQLKELSGS